MPLQWMNTPVGDGLLHLLRSLSSISTGCHYAKHQPSQLPVAMALGSFLNRRIFESHWFHQPKGIVVIIPDLMEPRSNYTALGTLNSLLSRENVSQILMQILSKSVL